MQNDTMLLIRKHLSVRNMYILLYIFIFTYFNLGFSVEVLHLDIFTSRAPAILAKVIPTCDFDLDSKPPHGPSIHEKV